MKDVLGRELKIGDSVVTTGYEGMDLSLGTVVGFTPQMIKVSRGGSDVKYKQRNYVAKVTL
jgi:hypothetical protein